MDKKQKTEPLYASGRDIHDNFKLGSITIDRLTHNKVQALWLAAINFLRAKKLINKGLLEDIPGLQEAVRRVGLNPDVDPASNIEREFYPVTGEKEMLNNEHGNKGERFF